MPIVDNFENIGHFIIVSNAIIIINYINNYIKHLIDHYQYMNIYTLYIIVIIINIITLYIIILTIIPEARVN